MKKDRGMICKIISDMLDNPDEYGIYPTSKAYNELERYVEGVRGEAIGWAHANACIDLDNGKDPRQKEVPELLERAMVDLTQPTGGDDETTN